MVNLLKSVALFMCASQVACQEPLLDTPIQAWSNQVIPTVTSADPGVRKDNGITLSPDEKHLLVTSVGATVSSFDAATGAFEWEYNPPAFDGGVLRSHSRIVFTTPRAESPYMVYSIVENENSVDATSRVVALDLDGNELWVSESLDGVHAGSPVISDDGSYVFLTHNAEFKTIGYFTALWAAGEGEIFYSQSNTTTPFAPLGIFHSPVEGNYDGPNGVGNSNDFIMWCMSPKPTDTAIGPGWMFGFQFPVTFSGNASEAGYFLLGQQERTFQGETAPVMTNQGLSGYFGTTRSNFWGWVGSTSGGRGRFNRGPQGLARLARNPNFAGQTVFATPALSSDTEEPFVFGGSAAFEFVKLNFDFTDQTVQTTNSFIKAEARVDPFDRVVYYVEEDGLVHQADFNDISDIWTVPLANNVEGEMAISSNGYYLYTADTRGVITALQVGDIPVTEAPSDFPTTSPSESPTAAPITTEEPSGSPVPPPSDFPSMMPSVSPSAATPAPVIGPEPTEAPVVSPPDSGAFQPVFLVTLAALAASMLL